MSGVTGPARAAAFGNCPEWTVKTQGVEPAGARERWLAAVVLGGQGRYAAAATLLGTLRTTRDPVLASLAASTLAAHRRQVGGHEAARRLDSAALGLLGDTDDAATDADGVDSLGARSDALVGLAADALGTGRIGAARRLIGSVEGLADPRWRTQVRLNWVRAEVELADGRAGAAVPPAELAVARARSAGAARHETKSTMVLAAAVAAVGRDLGRARGLALGAFGQAMELGLLPLAWPCALLLADLDPPNADQHRERAAGVLHRVLQRCDSVARRLAIESPWIPTELCRLDQDGRAGIRANPFTELPPDRVKVGPEASDREMERHSAAGRSHP